MAIKSGYAHWLARRMAARWCAANVAAIRLMQNDWVWIWPKSYWLTAPVRSCRTFIREIHHDDDIGNPPFSFWRAAGEPAAYAWPGCLSFPVDRFCARRRTRNPAEPAILIKSARSGVHSLSARGEIRRSGVAAIPAEVA